MQLLNKNDSYGEKIHLPNLSEMMLSINYQHLFYNMIIYINEGKQTYYIHFYYFYKVL